MENWTEKIKKILKEIRSQRRWRVILTTMAGAVVFVTTYALILPGITLEEEVALEDPGIFLEGDFAEDAEAELPVDGGEEFFLEDDLLVAEDQELDGFADAGMADDLATLEGYQEYEGAVDAEALGLDAGLADGIVTDGFLIEDTETLELEDELSTDHFRIRMGEDAMVPVGTSIAVKEVKDVQLYQETAAMLLGADIDAVQVYEIRLKKDDQEILPMADVTVEATVEAAKSADAVLAFSDPTYAKQAEVLEQSDRLVFETDEITYIAFCSMSDALEAQELAEVQDLPDAMEVEAAWDEEVVEVVDDAFSGDVIEEVAAAEEPMVTEEPVLAEEPVVEDDVLADEPVIEEVVTDEPVIEEVIADEPVVEEEIVTVEPVAEEAVIDDGQIVEEAAATEEPVAEEALEEVQPVETEAPAVEEAPIMEGLAITLARENAEETEAPEAEEVELTTEQEAPAQTEEAPLPVGIAMELYLGGSEGTIGAVEIETEAPAEMETSTETEEAAEAEMVETVAEEETEAVLEEVAAAEAVTEAAEAVEEAETEAAEAVAEEETEAAEAASEVVTEAAEAVAEEETEAAEAVEEVVTEAAEVVVEEETEAAEAVAEAATEAVEETTEAAGVLAPVPVTDAEAEEDIEYTVQISEETGARGTFADMGVGADDIAVIYTNDIHGGISNLADYSGSSASLGFAGLAAVKAEAEEAAAAVTTVDIGDAIFGSVVASESTGRDVIDLMKLTGYDILTPGNHEFDFSMDTFLEYKDEAIADGVEYISANFVDNRTGEPVLDPYVIVPYTVGGKEIKVGYVGMTSPETLAKSTPTYFQDEEGNYIYGFSAETNQQLYDTIQAAVDAAYEDGADMIIALSHMGDTGVEAGWSAVDVALNTTGIDVILDGHAHSVLPSDIISNANGEDVLITSTGTKLENIGVLTLSVDDANVITASAGLVSELTEEEMASDAYAEMDKAVADIELNYDYLFEVEGTTDFDLVIYDPANPDVRLVRNANTNMADFVTDAYRSVTGADIAFLNGGSIRANISAGEIQYIALRNVFPWGTLMSVIEVTGQQILDCLEMGAREYPEECGGFIVPSGLTYTIDATIPENVNVNSDGEFVSVDGEYRVKDVMVGDEPLDLEKTYTLAINDYYSIDCGDGMTMFKGSKVVDPADGGDHYLDISILIEYLASLEDGGVPDEYSDPYGQGRITFYTGEEAQEAETEAVAAAEEAVTEEAAEEATEGGEEEVDALEEAATEAAEAVEATTEAAKG